MQEQFTRPKRHITQSATQLRAVMKSLVRVTSALLVSSAKCISLGVLVYSLMIHHPRQPSWMCDDSAAGSIGWIYALMSWPASFLIALFGDAAVPVTVIFACILCCAFPVRLGEIKQRLLGVLFLIVSLTALLSFDNENGGALGSTVHHWLLGLGALVEWAVLTGLLWNSFILIFGCTWAVCISDLFKKVAFSNVKERKLIKLHTENLLFNNVKQGLTHSTKLPPSPPDIEEMIFEIWSL